MGVGGSSEPPELPLDLPLIKLNISNFPVCVMVS